MDDEPSGSDRDSALTPGSVITIPKTANEFAIKEAKTCWYELNEGTIETWDELRTTFISRFFPSALFDRLLGEIRAFSQHENESLTDAWLCMKEMLRNCHGHNLSKDEGNSNSDTDKIMARMDVMTIKMDAQYKELQSRAKKPTPDLTLKICSLKLVNFTFPADFVILEKEEDSKVPLILGRPFLHTADAVIRVKQKQLNLGVGTERMIFNIDSAMKHSYSNDDTCFSIDEILEEDCNALLDEGSKILHSIEGTLSRRRNLFVIR
ncbi:reverse transcriptase domain-containing protein [Tanacetum coccineum]